MSARAKPPELEDVHALSHMIAHALGWHYDVNGSCDSEQHLRDCARIRPGLTPYAVLVRADWKDAHYLLCIGDVPTQDKEGTHRHTYMGQMPRIRVRSDRGAEAIAREIKRRLLPAYTPIYDKAQRSLEEDNAYIDERDRALEVLTPFGRFSHDRGDRRRVFLDLGDHGVATVSTRGVTLDVTCTAEQASQILQFLRDDTSV